MATTTTTQPPSSSPFARLSRLGLGLGLKSQPSSTYSRDTKVDDEDWYIAYNGPYEIPKDLRKRDSWGDIIEEEGADTLLNDAHLIRRYGAVGNQGGADYRRGRAHSTTSRLTSLSAAIDPSRKSVRSTQRRPPHSKRAPVSSFINLDAAGGVGESPMPPQRSPTSSTSARTSFASFLFGSPSMSSKKLHRSPSTTDLVHAHAESTATSPPARKSTSLDIPRPRHQSLSVITEPTASANQDDYYNSYYSTLITTPQSTNKSRSRLPRVNTAVANPSDTLLESASPLSPTPEAQKLPHPYAYTEVGSKPAPSQIVPPGVLPTTFPILLPNHKAKDSVSSSSHHNTRAPAQTLQSAGHPIDIHNDTAVIKNLTLFPVAPLRNSVSVPNLRTVQSQQQSSRSPVLPTGVERWLSAETWCDAMIFPRPRFKIKQGHGILETVVEKSGSGKSSGRIVSPPPTPIARSADKIHDTGANGRYSFPKRTERDGAITSAPPGSQLLKARSATNLRLSGVSKESPLILDAAPTASSVIAPHAVLDSKGKAAAKAKLQKPRPKHLLLNNLALRSEPSLEQVLNEGDQLEERRRQWQAQAIGSFGNKQTRSLSRGRAKSLNHRDSRRLRKDKHASRAMGNIDFLATRTLLGNQGVAPTIVIRVPPSQSTKTETNTGSSKSHSYTNSHAHSNSTAHSNSQKSSQGVHRGHHSRNDSWSQSALKLAKSTASGALCGRQTHSTNSPVDEKAAAIEGAIMATETKIIRLHEQSDGQEEDDFVIVDSKALFRDDAAPVQMSTSNEDSAVEAGGIAGVSPTPSGATGNGVGIALSTPPPFDGQSRRAHESLSMPDHPYAQRAAYFFHHTEPTGLELNPGLPSGSSEYAGPHPSSPKIATIASGAGVSDVSIRHRLPPQAALQSLPRMVHPYAMGSYAAEPKTDSTDVIEPEPRAQYNEPNEIGNYVDHAYAGISIGNPKTLGLGEAMAPLFGQKNASNFDREDRAVAQETQANTERNSQTWPPPVHRKPVSYAGYDESFTPAYQGSEASTPSPEHLNPPIFQRDTSTSTIGNSSGSSLQHSPRPLGNVDDLDRFHDLFYKPEKHNPESASSESRKAIHSGGSNDPFPWDVNSTRSVRSGLSNLARRLTEEYEERRSQEPSSDGHRIGGLEGHRPPDIRADHGFIFSNPTEPRTASPEPLPLHLGNKHTKGPEDDIPEDVRSSRASSILERASAEDGLPVRFGAVGALATPPAVVHEHRASGHFSLVADEAENHQEARIGDGYTGSLKDEPQHLTSSNRLSPPSVDPIRSSYMTSTTEGSRMSGLSDFPVPPDFPSPPLQHLIPTHLSSIPSHFGDGTPQKSIEDMPSVNQSMTAENRNHTSYRMTFGGSEDVESITPVV